MKNHLGSSTLGVLGLIAVLLFFGFSVIDYVEDTERKSKPPITRLDIPSHLSPEERRIYAIVGGIVRPTTQDAIIVVVRRLMDGEVLVLLPIETWVARREKYTEAMICSSVSMDVVPQCGQPWMLVDEPLTEGLRSGNSLFLSYNPDNGDVYVSDRLQFTLRRPKQQ